MRWGGQDLNGTVRRKKKKRRAGVQRFDGKTPSPSEVVWATIDDPSTGHDLPSVRRELGVGFPLWVSPQPRTTTGWRVRSREAFHPTTSVLCISSAHNPSDLFPAYCHPRHPYCVRIASAQSLSALAYDLTEQTTVHNTSHIALLQRLNV